MLYSVMIPFWTALAVGAVFALPIYRLLLRLNSRQTISQYAPETHQIKQGTPTMGGLIIILGTLAGIMATAVGASGEDSLQAIWQRQASGGFWPGIITLLLSFALIGFVDDFVVPRIYVGKRGLGWKQKIVMQVFFACVATGLLLGWTVSLEAATYVFLILFCANAYNFLDGLDALAGSVLIVLCGGLLALSTLLAPYSPHGVILFALIGATIPFLFLNAPPAKAFMGDVGSMPIGALLGVVFAALAFTPGGGWTFYTPYSTLQSSIPATTGSSLTVVGALVIIGFVLIAELVPVPMQILSVKLFKMKIFPYTPIHGSFEKKGWAETRVVWSFLLVQVILCFLAYSLVSASSYADTKGPEAYRYTRGQMSEQP